MKKILILIFALFFISFVSAVETTSVYYKVTVEVKPVCTSTYSEIITNSTNQTINQTECHGIIEIMGIEDNHLTIIENFSNSAWKRTFSGVKLSELGNESDISGIMNRLDEYDDLYNKLERCKDSNRNCSVNLMNIEGDSGYKSNFTSCETDKDKIQTKFDTKSQDVSQKNIEIEDLKSSLWIRFIMGLLVGALVIKFGLPYIKNKDTPKDETEKGFHSNAPA